MKAKMIIEIVNQYHNIDCRIRSRERRYVYPRFQAVGLILEMTHTTKSEIGRMFNYTHPSVVNGESVFKHLCEHDKFFNKQVEDIKSRISNAKSARRIFNKSNEIRSKRGGMSSENYINFLESTIDELCNKLHIAE